MTTSFSVDHFVIAVNDLPAATASYTRLGFNVTPGGRHTHAPTQNALVYFEDGSYFELIEWLAPAEGEKWYEALGRHGDGLVDFALVPADLPAAVRTANHAREIYGQPVDGSRINADGLNIRWQLAWPPSHALPFLCGDTTPRHLRVPEGPVRVHGNGVTGVSCISVRVNDLAQAASDYRALLGTSPSVRIDAVQSIDAMGLDVLRLAIGSTQLNLVSPSKAHDTAAARAIRDDLRQHGEGPYKLTLRSSGAALARPIGTEESHGVNLHIASDALPLESLV